VKPNAGLPGGEGQRLLLSNEVEGCKRYSLKKHDVHKNKIFFRNRMPTPEIKNKMFIVKLLINSGISTVPSAPGK
jgi:hypothetical protein